MLEWGKQLTSNLNALYEEANLSQDANCVTAEDDVNTSLMPWVVNLGTKDAPLEE